MDTTAQLNALVELLGRLGVEVRYEHLGGDGSGICEVRGRRMLFVDLDADQGTQLERCLEATASLPGLDEIYVTPALRELIENPHR